MRTLKQRTLKQRAMALLARREHSRAELERRLAATEASAAEVGGVLDELESAGLLSDVRFSAALVAQKQRTHGRRAIAQALRRSGVGSEQAAAALAELSDDDEFTRALALWTRRFGDRPPADDREAARQIRFLLARGYAGSVAHAVVRGNAGQRSEESGG